MYVLLEKHVSHFATKDTAFYFDTTDPYRPKFKKSNRALLSSIADEIRAKPDGGFYITYMGSALGTAPGRLIETDENFDIIHEWPEDVDGTLNILDKQHSPHGLSIDWEKKLILTSDFVEPISILKPSLGVRHADTLRLWDLDTKKILNTITIPDVRFHHLASPRLIPLLLHADLDSGRWYSRCQVHSWKRGIRCSCHGCPPWSGVDYLPSAQG